MNRLVAILLATYNGASYLSEQLESILKQDFDHWICYLHDDGSSDDTMTIIESYIKKYPDKFIYLKYPPTGGAKNNFLSMLKVVNNFSYKYILFCDQDDVWLPNKISLTINALSSLEDMYGINEPSLAFTDLYVVDERLNIQSNSFMQYAKHNPKHISFKDLCVTNPAPGCTIGVNRALAMLSTQYENADAIEMHDWWCMLIAAASGHICYIDKSTIMYRQHGNNTLGAINKHGLRHYLSLLMEIISGRKIIETRQRIISKENMVHELLIDLKSKNNNYEMFMTNMSEIRRKNKISRLFFYLKNHLYNSIFHAFWILICC